MIYLDGNATTQCDPGVVDKMVPYFTDFYGNASSEHPAGKKARDAVEEARYEVASLIGAKPDEIIFTSGATESNNLVFFGLSEASNREIKNKIITADIEHRSVLSCAEILESKGYQIVKTAVDPYGNIKFDEIINNADYQTLLVSIQTANNEIGTLQDIQKISGILKNKGVLFHTDAAQACGKIKINVNELGADFLSISAHKMYGPKGVGALYIRDGVQNNPISPILYGGSQESGLRAGTLNVPGIVGFGEAARIARNNLETEVVKTKYLRDLFEEKILSRISNLSINGNTANRLPGTTSLTFRGVEANSIIANANGLCMSTGSACSANSRKPSHVLKALGLSEEEVYSTIRFTFGRFNSTEDVELAVDKIAHICALLKQEKKNEICNNR